MRTWGEGCGRMWRRGRGAGSWEEEGPRAGATSRWTGLSCGNGELQRGWGRGLPALPVQTGSEAALLGEPPS